MAHLDRRAQGYVYVYTYVDGKQTSLPRSKVKHLDGQPDSNIDAWVKQYQEQWEGKKLKEEKILYDGSELSKMVKSYLAYLTSRRRSMNTIKEYERALMRHVIPFFLSNDPPLRDPQQWPGKSIRMLAALEAKGITSSVIVACNKALRSFYNYLADEGLVQTGIQIRLRRPVSEIKRRP